MRKNGMVIAYLAAAVVLSLSACGPTPMPTPAPATETPTTAPTEIPPTLTPVPFVFGMLLIGPRNDQGWNQAIYEGGQYAEQHVAGARMIYLENVFSGSPSYPGQTVSQIAATLVSQGAKLIFFSTDYMKDEALKFAQANPDIYVVGVSDDTTWKDGKNYQASPNQVDVMGRMEDMQMIAGCAAALTTQSGKIGFLGALINDATRRLAASAFLGAKYCWANILGDDPAKLTFNVNWLNISGTYSDPTKIEDGFYNGGYDVIISILDSTEALVEAQKANATGKMIWATAYDNKNSCSVVPEVCLGVAYYKWGPAFAALVQTVAAGTWSSNFQWNGPDWKNINNPDTSAVGFVKGNGLSVDASTKLDGFISQLAGGLNLWKGPLNLQDKTVYLADGITATDQQIWYLPQFLEGMESVSMAK